MDGVTGLRTKGGQAALLVGEKETKTKRALFKDCMPGASPAKLPIKETAVVLHYRRLSRKELMLLNCSVGEGS